MLSNAKILFIGCGKMGSAILRGVKQKSLGSFVVVDPASPPEDLKSALHAWVASPDQIPASFFPDIVVIAVKPQQLNDVLPLYSKFEKCVWISVAAGKTIKKIENLLSGNDVAIVRAMPNLPASIGRGISAAVANRNVSEKQMDLCSALLNTIGQTIWIENEALMDAVTALSGSGPAYLFALVEAMAAAGEKIGLDATTAAQLAKQTVIGSAALLEQSPESPETLRKAVTSPGGTTAAALQIMLADDGLPNLMLRAIKAATKRSQELAD